METTNFYLLKLIKKYMIATFNYSYSTNISSVITISKPSSLLNTDTSPNVLKAC